MSRLENSTVVIRDNFTGEEVSIRMFTHDEGSFHLWSDGNFSCDCNRHSFFFFEGKGIEDFEVMRCGDGHYSVRVVMDDGLVIVDEL